nr:uncharacterized protein LOC103414477 [Malus domestica]
MQLDLDGLVKTLNEHCKKYGLRRKPTTLTELPFEGAADWDEDWDKFEDKCMPKMSYYSFFVVWLWFANLFKSFNYSRNHHQFRKKKLPQLRVQQQLLHLKLMFSQKSLKMRMTRPLKMEQHMIKMKASQQKVLRTVHLLAVLLEGHLENFQILTMQRQQTQMPHPVIRNLKVMIMRVLGLCFLVTKVPMNQHGGHLTIMMTLTRCGVSVQLVPPRIWIRSHYFSGPGEFGLNPIRTGSSQGGGFSQKSRPFTFDDSVPSTPLSAFNSGYSPPRYKDSSEPSFDTFSRFDSFRITQDTGFFPQLEALGRFDSMRSSRDFDQGHAFPTFDDIPDPFGSSVPFRSSLDNQTPRRDSDPFGSSGPFRTSLDSQTP